MSSENFALKMIVFLMLFVVTAILCLGVGAVYLPPQRIIYLIFAALGGLSESREETIILILRLPRILLSAYIGAGLSTAGAAFQGLFRNPLATPFVVGASGGAAIGAILAITSGLTWAFWGVGAVPIAAFLGSLVAVFIVYFIASAGSSSSTITLLLAGTALSTILTAIVSLIMLLSDKTLHETFNWLMGGLSGRTWPHLFSAAPLITVGIIVILLLSRALNALASGEETARSLGLPVELVRLLIIGAASLITASAVAAAGVIGFVGLIAPHMARIIFGAAHERLIPGSIMIGALLMMLSDLFARTILAPIELPVGIVTSILGGLFFLYLLKSGRAIGGRL